MVYIETTIVSVLTARESKNVVKAADQFTTRNWWNTQRDRFDLVTSELVLFEASAGDSNAAKRRMDVLGTLPLIRATAESDQLAAKLIRDFAVPLAEERDALHIATAAMNGIDYLLTWNCTHLANAELRDKITQACIEFGVRSPTIATPNQLLGERPNG